LTNGEPAKHEGAQQNDVGSWYLAYLKTRGFAGIHEFSSLTDREQNGKAND
jgi:hypothetical protein